LGDPGGDLPDLLSTRAADLTQIAPNR
jgi:hypothetical protein